MNGIRDKIFFLSFSAYLILFWRKVMPERGFLIFLLFFSEFSSPGRVWTEFQTKIFFLSFSVYLIPFWLKLMPKIDFLIFWFFFLYFFSEFSCPGRVWTEFGTKFFFFLFLGLPQPVLDRNNAGKRFFNFLNLFAIFFGIFLPVSSMNEIRD